MNISYDYYRVFYYVAKYENFTQAANALMSNQPNVTRTIKKLESELGCTLFIRSNHGVTLTPEGKKLYEHISFAFEHILAGENEILLDKSLQNGTVTISSSEIALHCCLLPVLQQFRRLYPNVRIKVLNHTTLQAISALKNGFVDIAVETSPIADDKAISVTDVMEIQDVPVCGSAFSFLAEKPVSLNELAKYPIISLADKSHSFNFYSQFFSKAGITFSPDIETATATQILPMVKCDLGVGFIPADYVASNADMSNLYLITLDVPIPKRKVCLLKQKGHNLSVAAKEMERMVLSIKNI